MIRRYLIFMLGLAWSITAIGQSTTIGVKIGNNGNLTLNNKYRAGNYSEIQNFGNGYQGGVHINQRLFKGLDLRGEFTYMNSTFEMDHDSHWPGEFRRSQNSFYEEIVVNSSSFNFSGNLVLNFGRVKLGVGPEVSLLTQANGRGTRYNYGSSSYDGLPQSVQYRFFANRKQVYNRDNPDEKFAYDANRVLYGLDMNVNVVVYKPFSAQFKVFYPLNDFIEEFTGFENDVVNQKTINAQISVIYTFEYITHRSYVNSRKKKKRR